MLTMSCMQAVVVNPTKTSGDWLRADQDEQDWLRAKQKILKQERCKAPHPSLAMGCRKLEG
jgi:hypothetical protein